MQLVVPIAVRAADTMLAMIWRMTFHVSLFFILMDVFRVYLLLL